MKALCGAAALVLSAVAGQAAMTGLWQFNGNLENSFSGGPSMAAVGGWTPTYQSYTGAAGAEALVFPEFTASQWLALVPTGLQANGGGNYVNQYSIMMDVKFNNTAQWISLFQMDANNTSDGDSYIENDGTGIGILNDYGNSPQFAFANNTWYRITIVGNLSSSSLSYYVNGTLVNTVSVTSAVDGRFAPYTEQNYLSDTSKHNGSNDYDIKLFADNSGTSETASGAIASLALFNTALSASEVASYGTVDSAGIAAVPEPSAGLLLLMGLACLSPLFRRFAGSRP